MTAILSATCFCSSDAIILEPLEYLAFHSRDTFIELSLLWWSFPIDPFLVFHY